MKFIVENWYIILGLVLIIGGFAYAVYTFINCPTDKKLSKVKEWLLYAVTEAEKNLGGGTGQIKLRYVYDMFLVKFPYVAKIVSFDEFSKLVDEALVKFRDMLSSNTAVQNYVNNKEDTKNE